MGKLRNLSEYTNKTKLNPKIFDGEALKKKLRIVLLKIANQFYKELDINIPIEDVVLTGSSANYNWTPKSDIDIHIIIDMDKAKDVEMARKYFTAAEDAFSDKYNLKYGSNSVEVYVQHKSQPHHSTGIYSIKNNKWVKKPTYAKVEIEDSEIKKKVDPIKRSVDKVDPTKPGSAEKLSKIKDKIKALRQAGLEREGEYSLENLVFKQLRNDGTLEKLANKKIEARKAEMGDGIVSEFITQQESKIHTI